MGDTETGVAQTFELIADLGLPENESMTSVQADGMTKSEAEELRDGLDDRFDVFAAFIQPEEDR